MFAQLETMLKKGDTLNITIARENDTQLRVCVFPKLFNLNGQNSDESKALNTPFTLVATAPELDSPEFTEQFQKFAGSTTVLRHTLDEVEAAHKAAAEAAKAKPAAKAGKSESKEPKVKAAEEPAAEEAEAEGEKII